MDESGFRVAIINPMTHHPKLSAFAPIRKKNRLLRFQCSVIATVICSLVCLQTKGAQAAKPNILSGGNTLATLWVDSTTPFTLSAQLYNVAGERLGPAWQGKTGGKQVDVDLEGMASGLYFAIVDLRDPQGGLAAKQVTQIVLRK